MSNMNQWLEVNLERLAPSLLYWDETGESGARADGSAESNPRVERFPVGDLLIDAAVDVVAAHGGAASKLAERVESIAL